MQYLPSFFHKTTQMQVKNGEQIAYGEVPAGLESNWSIELESSAGLISPTEMVKYTRHVIGIRSIFKKSSTVGASCSYNLV